MTDTPAHDVKATLAQCIRAFEAGADYMRIGIPDKAAVHALGQLKKGLKQSGFHQPLIADVHFSATLSLQAARIADKVRINPGNYTPRASGTICSGQQDRLKAQEIIRSRLKPLTGVCREYGTAIRIGTNAASLPQHVIASYGRGAEAMVEVTMEFLQALTDLGFYRIVVSLKASDPLTTIRAYRLMAERMKKEKLQFPMHTGVTEAGEGISGRVKSALGIILLLQDGIGATFRASLTDPPEAEIAFAKALRSNYRFARTPQSEASGMTYTGNNKDGLIARIVAECAPLLLGGKLSDFDLHTPGISDPRFPVAVAESLMQACGLKSTATEFVVCPGCARCNFNIREVIGELRKRLPEMPGRKIAVMGCAVNGPGEIAEANYGLLGTPAGSLNLYRGKRMVVSGLEPAEALEAMEEMIKRDLRKASTPRE